MKFLTTCFFASAIFLIISCQDEKQVILSPVVLESSDIFVTKELNDIKSFISSAGLPISSTELKFDVDIYKVTYTTTYKNQSISASGLVLLPKTKSPVGVLSFQHGTISAHRDAPTETSSNNQILNFYAAMASVGFIGIIPDYIGFGASKSLLHPYYVEDATATAVLDNIKAGRELALMKGLALNNKLFLAGYSEGGYATMATHKAIEEQGYNDLDLIASFPASGGYDVKAMQEYFFGLDTYHEPYYLAYVAQAYKTHYDWSQPLTLIFNQPYASMVPGLFDGSKGGSEINAQLTDDVTDYVNAALLKTIDTNPDYNFIRKGFTDNSLKDWSPKIPMYMYHGTADDTVPFSNSEKTFEKLLANGTSPSNISLTPLYFANHATGVTPYIIELTNKLLAFK